MGFKNISSSLEYKLEACIVLSINQETFNFWQNKEELKYNYLTLFSRR
jgi:Txe/YoeB family toxin of Txe-Axe toxin-antitoxin module